MVRKGSQFPALPQIIGENALRGFPPLQQGMLGRDRRLESGSCCCVKVRPNVHMLRKPMPRDWELMCLGAKTEHTLDMFFYINMIFELINIMFEELHRHVWNPEMQKRGSVKPNQSGCRSKIQHWQSDKYKSHACSKTSFVSFRNQVLRSND